MRAICTAATLSAFLLTLPAAGAGEPKRKAYETPQAAFDAAKKAIAKDDWRTFCDALTPESRDLFAGIMVLSGGGIKAGTDQALGKVPDEQKALVEKFMKELLKPLIDTYAKHGVKEEDFKKLKSLPEVLLEQDPTKLKAFLLKAAEPVKERTAFVVELMGTLKKLARMFKKDAADDSFDFLPRDGRLVDLQVEGDRAKGVMVGTKKGKEERTPLAFKKDRQGWKIDLPLDNIAPTPRKGAPRDPQPKETGALPRNSSAAPLGFVRHPAVGLRRGLPA